MQTLDFSFFDSARSRSIPVNICIPKGIIDDIPVVIFSPGFQGQDDLVNADTKLGYKNYTYLADYFVKHGYAFVTIQHDLLGDKDGLETIDPKMNQHDARRHLYVRGVDNILFVLQELKTKDLGLKLDRFIIGGHSNGGDISKYFTNLHGEMVSEVITFDARRCRFEPSLPIKLLMFEANDTSTDLGVLPEPENSTNTKRANIEWTIIKPAEALHVSYSDNHITDTLKITVFKALDWFFS
jgi:pimeloyl-ACP methyl ester carboxylesterase